MHLWRAFVPRWAHAPLSGEGASRFGGRWNPVGAPTIYAACELSTAWAEYNQGFVQHPAMIVQLELKGARLADTTDQVLLRKFDVTADIHRCEWRMLMDESKVPAPHQLRERLIASRYHGVIYPSFMSLGGTCVALWEWNMPDAPELRAIDPEGRLPKSPASWL
ncbi:RES family NAD+ phosphorylase [Rhizobium mongolense]|uniref:RES domain-containing protein n=2 Tax=Rhizobium mongolense TaxID=57676 RepID=A0ABR6IPN2_9HYPH|nr:RES domain-containing protein [Rhizobium mongolense]MBB4229655.1 RES domain-containing protein [Rhizobium mongolense]TVZ73184.1 RES domain-containing protein [Rhizobium mongolense USDA 1844]